MICRGPEPSLDVVLQNRRVFAREGGMGIFFPFFFYFIIILIVRRKALFKEYLLVNL